MKKVVKGSIRKLNARSLVVDWGGGGNLFYRMSKAQVRDALKNGHANMRETFDGGKKSEYYPVRRFPSGSIAIGCEHFNKTEVAELRKWSRK